MIIFLYGEDIFNSSQKVSEIKNKYLLSDPIGSGLSVFDYENKDRKAKPLDVFGMPNLLAPKRLVIVKNLMVNGSEKEQEEMLDYLKKNKSLKEDINLVILFFEKNQPKKTNSFFKFLEKNSKSQRFEKLVGIKLNQWALKKIKEINIKTDISKTALEKLVLYTGEDIFLLNNEIQKLINFTDTKNIKDEDVELLVRANVDSNIFATIDALGNKNKKEALRLLHRHLEQGEDPFYILSMFIYQFRNLIKVADLKESQNASEYEIAKIAKLHPFVVKKSLGQLRNFSLIGQSSEQLKKVYQKLSNLDLKVKTGQIEIKLALDKFIIEL